MVEGGTLFLRSSVPPVINYQMRVSHLLDRPIIHDNFFDQVSWRELLAYVDSQDMKYGSKSAGGVDPHGHWAWKPVYDDQQNLADITGMLPPPLKRAWDQVCARLYEKEPRAVLRSYVNGYTYGTDGYFHADSSRVDEDTIIIYMVTDWKPDWAGETVYLDKNKDIIGAVLPRANRVVVGPSNMPHAARAVSRLCTTLRRTLMFKTRRRWDQRSEDISTWLQSHGALGFKHGRGSLHDHLLRVYGRMRARPCPEAACVGGAFHSIYGTNAFQHRLLPRTPEGRNMLAHVAGREAEQLAYAFSMIDRPRTLNEHAHDGMIVLDTVSEQKYQLTSELQKHYLCLIEAANLLDQGQLDKWPNLKAIWENKQRS